MSTAMAKDICKSLEGIWERQAYTPYVYPSVNITRSIFYEYKDLIRDERCSNMKFKENLHNKIIPKLDTTRWDPKKEEEEEAKKQREKRSSKFICAYCKYNVKAKKIYKHQIDMITW